jgi:outer membrane protein
MLLNLAVAIAQNSTQKPMSLKECIRYSLENHISNDICTNDIKIAGQKALEGVSGYLPQVNSSVSLDDNLKRPVTIIPAGLFGPNESQIQLGAQYSTTAVVQLDQTIYDQSLIYGIRANKPNQEIAGLKKEKNDEDLIYNTAASYYQVLIFKAQEKLLSENEKKYTELITTLKLQYEKGVIKKVDYDRVNVGLNNIVSQKNLLQTNIQLAMNNLKSAIGMSLDSILVIADSVNFNSDIKTPGYSGSDVNNRLDYKIQLNYISLQEIDLKRKRASFLPTVSLYARYGSQALGDDFSKSYDHWFNYSAIGLKLNFPLLGGMRRISQLNQSQLSLSNARDNLKLYSENLNLQVQNSYTQLYSSYTALSTNKENMNLAKDVFETTSLQYQKGVAMLSDFLNAEYAYKEAQSNYITSLLNYLKAKISFEKANGTIKQYVNQL